MKTLKYLKSETTHYTPAQNASWALALIDRKNGTAQSKEVDNEHADTYKGKIFTKCREVFSKYISDNTKSILFYSTTENLAARISDLLTKVETKLKIPAATRSQVFATANPNITAIRAAQFWRADKLTWQMLTLFVKAGLCHEIDQTVNQTIEKFDLIKHCLPFVKLYLSGYTKFSNVVMGKWQNNHSYGPIAFFCGSSKEQILEANHLTK